MKYFLNFLIIFFAFNISTGSILAETLPVRVKDIAKILEVRENQLFGFGLVVGLRNTGDSKNSLFTNKALTNLLEKMGIPADKKDYTSRNVASVMVTAKLPPFIRKGQNIDVVVSSLGDATSLVGGTLLLTPLKGADFNTYAVAQGAVIVGGISETSVTSRLIKNQATVGRITNGAIVEEEVPIQLKDKQNLTLVLNEANFINSAKLAQAIINEGFKSAAAIDANTIRVPLINQEYINLVDTIAKIENIKLIPDASARIIINSKTGTVVIGEMVRLMPVAITQGDISIKISDQPDINTQAIPGTEQVETGGAIMINEQKTKLVYLNPADTLSSLVKALNQIGATPKDLISIIQALKESGALIAEVEIL